MESERHPKDDQATGSSGKSIGHGDIADDVILASLDATARLTTVAHELGNLLDGAMRYVAMARRGLEQAGAVAESGDTQIIRQLDAVQIAMGRMANLVQSALRPGACSLVDRLTEVGPLVEAVIHACDSLRPYAADQGVTIDAEFSPRLVLVDAGPIFPVLINTLRNAIEATEPGGHVKLIAEMLHAQGDEFEVQIDILDEGKGPPKAAGDHVFDLGFSTKATGMGIGLALSREIIEEIGGRLWLRPRTDGAHGAHLTLRFAPPGGGSSRAA